MNKKFSTLLACALVAGSFSFVTNATDEIPYRTQAVLSEQFDACLTGVKAINPDYYYQLQVNASGSGQVKVNLLREIWPKHKSWFKYAIIRQVI